MGSSTRSGKSWDGGACDFSELASSAPDGGNVAARAGAFTAITPKAGIVTACTDANGVDGHVSGSFELNSRRRDQIEMGTTTTTFANHFSPTRRTDSFCHVAADLVATRPDRRADPGGNLAGTDPQTLDRRGQNRLREAAPAGVYRGDPPVSCKQDRNAISGHHSHRQIAPVRDQGVTRTVAARAGIEYGGGVYLPRPCRLDAGGQHPAQSLFTFQPRPLAPEVDLDTPPARPPAPESTDSTCLKTHRAIL